jgi:hypothetical protein
MSKDDASAAAGADATSEEEAQLRTAKLDEIERTTAELVASAVSLKEMYDALGEEHVGTLNAFSKEKSEYAKEQERGRKKQKRELAQERATLEQEIADWEQEKISIAKTQTLATRIKLDVGGTRFTTSRTTLTLYPDTMLGAMFSGRHTMNTDEDGYHFIDRFAHFLSCRFPRFLAILIFAGLHACLIVCLFFLIGLVWLLLYAYSLVCLHLLIRLFSCLLDYLLVVCLLLPCVGCCINARITPRQFHRRQPFLSSLIVWLL